MAKSDEAKITKCERCAQLARPRKRTCIYHREYEDNALFSEWMHKWVSPITQTEAK